MDIKSGTTGKMTSFFLYHIKGSTEALVVYSSSSTGVPTLADNLFTTPQCSLINIVGMMDSVVTGL